MKWSRGSGCVGTKDSAKGRATLPVKVVCCVTGGESVRGEGETGETEVTGGELERGMRWTCIQWDNGSGAASWRA